MGDADLSESCVAGGRAAVGEHRTTGSSLPSPELADGLAGTSARAFRILVPVTDSKGTQQSPRSIGTSPTRTESPGC